MEINNKNSKVSELLEDDNLRLQKELSEIKEVIPYNLFLRREETSYNIISKLFEIKNNSGKQSEIDAELLNLGLQTLYNAKKRGD